MGVQEANAGLRDRDGRGGSWGNDSEEQRGLEWSWGALWSLGSRQHGVCGLLWPFLFDCVCSVGSPGQGCLVSTAPGLGTPSALCPCPFLPLLLWGLLRDKSKLYKRGEGIEDPGGAGPAGTHMQGVAGTPTPSTNLGPQWKEGRAEVSRYSRESHGHRALRIPWWRSSQGWWESEAEAVLTGSCPQTVSGRAWLDPWTGEGKVSPHSWEVLCRGWEGV